MAANSVPDRVPGRRLDDEYAGPGAGYLQAQLRVIIRYSSHRTTGSGTRS